jgi:hypothetical protein
MLSCKDADHSRFVASACSVKRGHAGNENLARLKSDHHSDADLECTDTGHVICAY